MLYIVKDTASLVPEFRCPVGTCSQPLKTLMGLVKHVVASHVEVPEDNPDPGQQGLLLKGSVAASAKRRADSEDREESLPKTPRVEEEAPAAPAEEEKEDDQADQPEENQLIECKDCGRDFTSKSKLKRHVHNVHSRKTAPREEQESEKPASPALPYPCSLCQMSFSQEMALEEHKLANHHLQENASLSCSQCEAKFSDVKTLNQHITNEHSEESHCCPECKKSFQNNKSLLAHLRRVHSKSHEAGDPGVLLCGHCKVHFEDGEALDEHVSKEHMNVHSCPECQRYYSKRKYLNDHVRKVHSQRDSAEREQQPQESLLQPCPQAQCHLLFKDAAALEQHIRLKHPSEGGQQQQKTPSTPAKKKPAEERSLKCAHCPMTFQKQWQLQRHEMRHRKPQQQDPPALPSGFEALLEADLVEEMEAASGQGEASPSSRDPAKCHLCDAQFTGFAAMQEHFRTSHERPPEPQRQVDRKPLFCGLCIVKFETRAELERHMEQAHAPSEPQQPPPPEEPVHNSDKEEEDRWSFSEPLLEESLVEEIEEQPRDAQNSCFVCGKVYVNKQKVSDHLRSTHRIQPNDRAAVLCLYCKEELGDVDSLEEHISRDHRKMLTCKVCRKTFKSLKSLQVHKRSTHN